jgi:hypothetical protein
MTFAADQFIKLHQAWQRFWRTPFVKPYDGMVHIAVDSQLPIFSQIAFSPPDGLLCFDITWHDESEQDKELFRGMLDNQLQMLTLNRAVIDTKFGPWHHNFCTNFLNGNLNHPFVCNLPKRKLPKALIVGNGPSASATSQFFRNHTQNYEVYTCWHGARRVPGTPDYVCHASTIQPSDIALTPIPGAVFVGVPTAAPSFYDVAKASMLKVPLTAEAVEMEMEGLAYGGVKYFKQDKRNIFIHCDPSNPYDTMFSEWRREPHAAVNPATVTTLCINTAIQCGHDDITLIGVDLTGPGSNDAQRAMIEQFPQVFTNIKFKNLSTSTLKGFENL